MPEETCILCGRTYPAGLHILGCLICFPCEQALLRFQVPREKARALGRLYAPAALRGGREM